MRTSTGITGGGLQAALEFHKFQVLKIQLKKN